MPKYGEYCYLLLFLCFLLPLAFSSIHIDTHTHLADQYNRTRLFHGVNIVVKNPPYTPILDNFHPLHSLSNEDYDYLIKFGFNTVRLGIIWEAVEVSPGIYNHTYLDIYESIINKLGERGIYTVLDSHQDMFSRILCGEGVPLFYAKELYAKKACDSNYLERKLADAGVCKSFEEFSIPRDEFGIPLIESCKKVNFARLHSCIELGKMYHIFFNNEKNVLDRFVEYWQVVAAKFKGNKYIIGYDIWNEPWVGNLFSEWNSFIPGQYTNTYFFSFYKRIDEGLRKIDSDFTLMFEEACFPDTLPYFGSLYLGGYKTTPAGVNYLHKQIWSAHHYCLALSSEFSNAKFIPLEGAKTRCKPYAEYKLRTARQKAEELGVPVFVTEFGACRENESCYYEIAALADACDKYLMSWQYWQYKPYGDHTTTCDGDDEGVFNPDGSLQSIKLRALTRPYLMAFQGQVIKNYYFTDMNILHSKFIYDSAIQMPSILYLHREMFYPKGAKLLLTSGCKEILHVVNYHMIIASSTGLMENETPENLPKRVATWDELYNIDIKENYLYFTVQEFQAINSHVDAIKHIHHLNEESCRVLDVLLLPKTEYTIKSQSYKVKSIEVTVQDLSVVDFLIGKYNQINKLMVKSSQYDNTPEILIEYKRMENINDLDEFHHSSSILKIIHPNEGLTIDQLIVPHMSIQLIIGSEVLFDIEIANMAHHFVEIIYSI